MNIVVVTVTTITVTTISSLDCWWGKGDEWMIQMLVFVFIWIIGRYPPRDVSYEKKSKRVEIYEMYPSFFIVVLHICIFSAAEFPLVLFVKIQYKQSV